MYIKNIKLKNFRNYKNQEINFNNKKNIIFGNNAEGKTNILEAIFISSLGKSFRTNKEKELIKENEEAAEVEINFIKNNIESNIKLIINEKKIFYYNKIQLKKISEILGKIYIVLFSPEDIGILKNDPSKRRRFLNIMISQLRPLYVYNLNKYNKILEQRNNYLKQIKIENKKIENLDIWDEQLAVVGNKIYEYRKEFIEKINKKIKIIHFNSTEKKENIEIKYISNISENYLDKIKKLRKIDIKKGFTTVGIHRDDFEIYINNKNISIFGSQGQQRSSLISLKLAEAEVIYDEVEEEPILLLDDFMSELDKNRINGFIENIKNNQILITCTEKFDVKNKECNFFYIKEGQVIN